MSNKGKNVAGFKKFSDIKSKKEELDPSLPISPEVTPVESNLPKDTKKFDPNFSERGNISESVQTIGKIARFPKNTKAHKAYNFLENVKISKKSIWYIMVEKNNELQMIKYNHKEGVDLNKFVNELKTYYINKNSDNTSICESISKIIVDGNDKYSMIKNIPMIEIEGKKIITKITEDLIKLLSK